MISKGQINNKSDIPAHQHMAEYKVKCYRKVTNKSRLRRMQGRLFKVDAFRNLLIVPIRVGVEGIQDTSDYFGMNDIDFR